MNTETNKIPLQTSDGYIFLRPEEISYIKSEDVYAYVHNGTKKYFISQSLKSIEALLLPHQFIRCHRGFVINIFKVKKIIKKQNCKLIMENGAEIPVSRSKKADTLSRLLNQNQTA